MSDAPERIWVDINDRPSGAMIGIVFSNDIGDVEYIRADLCLTLAQSDARVGAALREAAEVASLAPYKRGGMVCGCSEGLAVWTETAILALAPDAISALDRALERMRERCVDLLRKKAAKDSPDEGDDLPYWASEQMAAVEHALEFAASEIAALPLHEEPET